MAKRLLTGIDYNNHQILYLFNELIANLSCGELIITRYRINSNRQETLANINVETRMMMVFIFHK